MIFSTLLLLPTIVVAGYDQEESDYLIDVCGDNFLNCPASLEEQQINKMLVTPQLMAEQIKFRLCRFCTRFFVKLTFRLFRFYIL